MTFSEDVPNVTPPALTDDTILDTPIAVNPVKRYQISGTKQEFRTEGFDTKEEVATFVSMLISEGFTSVHINDVQDTDYNWL